MRGARTRLLSTTLVGAIVGAVAFSGCGGAGPTSSAASVTQITQAAYVTTSGPGFRLSFNVSGSIEGQSFTLSEDGAVYDHGTRGAMTETVDGKRIVAIYKQPYVYIQVPGKKVRGKPWARLDINGYAQGLGVSASANAGVDPSRWLDYLKAAGQVTLIGRETIRGQPTTRYHVLVDLNRYPSVVPPRLRAVAEQQAALARQVSGQSTLPLDVWIDSSSRVRRYHEQAPLCYEGERTSESISLELYDYGKQSAVAPPVPSEAADLTSQVKSESSQALQKLHC